MSKKLNCIYAKLSHNHSNAIADKTNAAIRRTFCQDKINNIVKTSKPWRLT